MPHNPPVDSFEVSYDLLPGLITDKSNQQQHLLGEERTSFFVEFAELWFVRAQLAYLFEERADTIIQCLQKGLEQATKASGFGLEANPWRIWDYLSNALVAGDYASVNFFSLLSENRLWDSTVKPVPWLIMQVQTLAALFRSLSRSDRVVPMQELYEAIFRTQLPEELNDQLPEIQNMYSLLHALTTGNATEFNTYLTMRMDLLERYFTKQNTAATAALLDLSGLGLCRLAGGKQMQITVKHVYLPLEILQVSAAPIEAGI